MLIWAFVRVPCSHGAPQPTHIVERRRSGLGVVEEASFPDGIPSPHVTLRTNGHELPFVRANVRIYSEHEEGSQEFKERCLWDSGAAISYILCRKLDKLGVKGEGYATAEVLFVFFSKFQR